MKKIVAVALLTLLSTAAYSADFSEGAGNYLTLGQSSCMERVDFQGSVLIVTSVENPFARPQGCRGRALFDCDAGGRCISRTSTGYTIGGSSYCPTHLERFEVQLLGQGKLTLTDCFTSQNLVRVTF